jgi:Ca2+-binding EF-hand superfamily protein
VKEAFNTLDEDRQGKVTHQQFKQLLQSRGQFIADKEALWL